MMEMGGSFSAIRDIWHEGHWHSSLTGYMNEICVLGHIEVEIPGRQKLRGSVLIVTLMCFYVALTSRNAFWHCLSTQQRAFKGASTKRLS